MLRQTWSFIENHDIMEINLNKVVMLYSGMDTTIFFLIYIRTPEKFQNLTNSFFLYNLTMATHIIV